MGHFLPEIGLVADFSGFDLAHDARRAAIGKELVGLLLQLLLVLVQRQVDWHRSPSFVRA
ncbi:MAG TPA: hypothetical protein VGO93_15320 [Candidatus Xenobia bacterium]